MLDELKQQFQQTFEDKKFTSSERKAMIAVLEDKELNPFQLGDLRSTIFKIAKSEVKSGGGLQIMDWLEVANKVLARQSVSESKTKETKSYFSPGEEGRDAIVAEINQARESLCICVFTISDNLISEAIKNAHSRNVKVRIITDDDKTFDRGSDIYELKEFGIPIRTDNTRNHMHHKFAVVDRELLMTGSYNWTRSAFKYNHENIMLISDANAVDCFCQEFDKLWGEFFEY